MINKIKFSIVGAGLTFLLLFSQGALAASKYEYSDEGSYNNLTVKDALGDVEMSIRMRVKWKTWTILGEPVVNCWQNWTAGSGTGEGGGGGRNFIKVGSDSLEFYWGDLPEDVRRKTRVNVEAYLIQSDTVNMSIGSAFVCQNGIDAGAGKWSSNFPASPNWNKFLTDGGVFNYQYNKPRKSMSALYQEAASRGYLSTDAAKKLYKNLKSYEYPKKILAAGVSLDSYYIKKWAVKEIAAKKADKAEQAKKKAATESLNQLDDLFSDFPEEGGAGSAGSSLGQLDGLFEEFPEEQQARKADEARQLKAELKASEDQHNKFLAKQKKKQRQLRGWEGQLSEVKKGKRKVKKGSSDSRQRYLALFKPAEPAATCYEVTTIEERPFSSSYSNECEKFCINDKGLLHGAFESDPYGPCSIPSFKLHVQKYKHGCLLSAATIEKGIVVYQKKYNLSDCKTKVSKTLPEAGTWRNFSSGEISKKVTVRKVKGK